MRDIKRLIIIMDLVNKLWIKLSYDLRFFQFIYLLIEKVQDKLDTEDLFYLEDDKTIKVLKELLYEE